VSTHSELEEVLGYTFHDAGLRDMALTHASVQRKNGDYERLEFLGDRVLGLVVAHMLYAAFPDEPEGALAKRHTGMVQRAALVRVAGALTLGRFLKLSAGEKKAGGERKDAILADALEALIGAVYLDGGFSAAEGLVRRFWQGMVTQGPSVPPEDPKTALQEWAQGHGHGLPEYRTVSKSGAEHAPLFEVEVRVKLHEPETGTASSKRDAEKEAARKMLEKVGYAI
jgi:ribonuclease-3